MFPGYFFPSKPQNDPLANLKKLQSLAMKKMDSERAIQKLEQAVLAVTQHLYKKVEPDKRKALNSEMLRLANELNLKFNSMVAAKPQYTKLQPAMDKLNKKFEYFARWIISIIPIPDPGSADKYTYIKSLQICLEQYNRLPGLERIGLIFPPDTEVYYDLSAKVSSAKQALDEDIQTIITTIKDMPISQCGTPIALAMLQTQVLCLKYTVNVVMWTPLSDHSHPPASDSWVTDENFVKNNRYISLFEANSLGYKVDQAVLEFRNQYTQRRIMLNNNPQGMLIDTLDAIPTMGIAQEEKHEDVVEKFTKFNQRIKDNFEVIKRVNQELLKLGTVPDDVVQHIKNIIESLINCSLNAMREVRELMIEQKIKREDKPKLSELMHDLYRIVHSYIDDKELDDFKDSGNGRHLFEVGYKRFQDFCKQPVSVWSPSLFPSSTTIAVDGSQSEVKADLPASRSKIKEALDGAVAEYNRINHTKPPLKYAGADEAISSKQSAPAKPANTPKFVPKRALAPEPLPQSHKVELSDLRTPLLPKGPRYGSLSDE